jgi:hypothetical protein
MKPLDLLEESLQILRSAGAGVLLVYWTGSLPFGISLLWLLRDTGFRWGGELMLRDSLFCAAAFVWMSYWKGTASAMLFSMLAPGTGSAAGWLKRSALQTIFQTIKLFVMPLAMASIVAWPSASLFFRTLALEPVSHVSPLRGGLKRAFVTAGANYQKNAVAFLTVAAFSVIVCLNILVALAILPSLWRILTGYETDWSRLETTGAVFSLFSVAIVMTWLVIDPWLHTYSMLRLSYQNARSDGRDLLRDISRLAAVVVICWLFVPAVRADQQQDLNQAIDRASQDVHYGWMHSASPPEATGFLGQVAKKARDGFAWAGEHIKSAYRSFIYWLRDLFGKQETVTDEAKKGKPHSQGLRWTLALLALLICGAIIALFLRSGRAKVISNQAAAVLPAADVFNEKLLPSDVRQDEWLRVAFEYLANNQTRLAARAFYLANLSYLGERSLLSLALWKSNRIYERELARQPRAGEISAAFATANGLYERAWYGMRELGAEQMETLKGSAEQLRA